MLMNLTEGSVEDGSTPGANFINHFSQRLFFSRHKVRDSLPYDNDVNNRRPLQKIRPFYRQENFF